MAFATTGSLVGLILLQPDFGTSVVYMFMFACMIFVFGIRYRTILIIMGAALVTLPIFMFGLLEKIFGSYQIERILSFLNPKAYARSGAYQVLMSIRYIGSGTLFGVEPGTEKAARNVPSCNRLYICRNRRRMGVCRYCNCSTAFCNFPFKVPLHCPFCKR